MKPVYLEFCGINSFSEPAKIDFSKLLEFGIFGIFGDTGSGKSTILDCIGFALYGNVARSRSGSIADIINYRQDKAYVHLVFEIVYEGKRRTYRVERTLKRKNATQAVVLYEEIDGVFTTISAGTRDTNAMLERIVGLEQKDFEKCIALPQGEFAQFVKAQKADRLRLIARLFDLEQYGEQLTKRVNSKYTKSANEVAVLKARLEPYAEVNEETIEALTQEIALRTEEAQVVREDLLAAREKEKQLAALLEKKREAERVARRLRDLEEKRSKMEELGVELSRLEKAAAVIAAEADGVALRRRSTEAEREQQLAQDRLNIAQEHLSALLGWDEEAADAEIERLAAATERAAQAKELRSKRKRAVEQMDEIARRANAQSENFKDFSYEAQRKALAERMSVLGEEDFPAFAEGHGKAALLRGEYAVFADELEQLTDKYPLIAADSVPLAEKYKILAQGETTDFASIRRAFDERERARKEIQTALIALEAERGKYDLHLAQLARMREEYARLRAEVKEYDALLAEDAGSFEELEAKLDAKRIEKRQYSERRRMANEDYAQANASLAAAIQKNSSAKDALEEGKKRFRDVLQAGAFQSAEEAETLWKKYGNAEAAKREYEAYKSDYAAVSARSRELSAAEIGEVSEEMHAAAVGRISEHESTERNLTNRIAVAQQELLRDRKLLAEKAEITREYDGMVAMCNRYERLKRLIEGNKFMEFIAEEYLQTVAVNASGRLITLTDGRYFLRYDRAFYVGDNFNGGELRGVHTLSGGETFLVSLSLALALGAEICAKSLRPIEFFFLDEGFGTLDEKLVDTVMDSLEKLRSEHFSIGIISHVEELKHRIDRKLSVVKATEKHGSQIQE